MLNCVATLAGRWSTRRRTRVANETTPTLTVHQIVAYNFTRARQQAGWTQVETSERLEPYLGYRLNQAGVSAIEKTYDSERRRNIDAAEIVAFARCFNLPIGWFFLPPAGHARDLIEPVHTDEPKTPTRAADLISLIVGTPPGWRSFLARLAELLERPTAAHLGRSCYGPPTVLTTPTNGSNRSTCAAGRSNRSHLPD